MKHLQTLLLSAFISCLSLIGIAQTIENNPYDPVKSTVFGDDIAINTQPLQNQHHVSFCSAFNGWLYSVYDSYNTVYNLPQITIMKSEDNGETWTVFLDSPYPVNNAEFTTMDLLALGNSLSELKVFLSLHFTTDYDSTGLGMAYVYRYNGVTGAYESTTFQEAGCSDISVTSDNTNPLLGTNPASVGILFSLFTYPFVIDSLFLLSSGDGGITFTNKTLVTSTLTCLHKVSLSYGKSPSCSNGRYFAVWEEKEDFYSTHGHLYAAHSVSGINSPFTEAICLDCQDPELDNLCRNPAVACQFNSTDNDSLNLTEVILFETYNPISLTHDIGGMFNKTAASSNHFTKFRFADANHNNFQPDVSFNPYNSTFIATYFDSADLRLPYYHIDFNLPNPGEWICVSPGYNDNTNISKPNPKIQISHSQKQGAVVWQADISEGLSASLFDASFRFASGLSQKYKQLNPYVNIFPNPCSSYVNIEVTIPISETTDIQIFNENSSKVHCIPLKTTLLGKTTYKLNVSDFPNGLYFFLIRSKGQKISGSIFVHK